MGTAVETSGTTGTAYYRTMTVVAQTPGQANYNVMTMSHKSTSKNNQSPSCLCDSSGCNML